jgi:hypothetical protein
MSLLDLVETRLVHGLQTEFANAQHWFANERSTGWRPCKPALHNANKQKILNLQTLSTTYAHKARLFRHKALTFFSTASETMNDVDGRYQLVRRWTEGRINWSEHRDTETGLLAFRTGLGPHGEIFIHYILHLPNIVVARWTLLRAAWAGAVAAVVQPRNLSPASAVANKGVTLTYQPWSRRRRRHGRGGGGGCNVVMGRQTPSAHVGGA